MPDKQTHGAVAAPRSVTGPATAEMPPPEVTLILIIVRHGQTQWNKDGRLQGHTDVPLSDEGREQARRLGHRLAAAWTSGGAASWLPDRPDVVFVSDLSRARETAALALAHVPGAPAPIIVTPLLRERGFADWEGLTAKEARERFGETRSHSTEGEPHAVVWDRMQTALGDIWTAGTAGGARDGVVLVVGHGGSLRQFACLAVGLDADAARHFHLDNTGVSLIEMRAGTSPKSNKGRILLWNDTAHLYYSPRAV